MKSELNSGLRAAAFAAALCLLLAPAAAAGQAAARGRLKEQANESARAFMAGDFGRLADLTYPKLVRLVGGRERMVAFLEEGVGGLRAKGFEVVSFEAGEPGEFVRAGREIFSLVPCTIQMKAPGGIVEQLSHMIGISRDGGASWTFVHGSSAERSKLSQLLPPAVVRRLRLPEPSRPVFHPAS